MPLSEKDGLLQHRNLTITSPWKEKLGYKVGYLFNRVATYTPEREEIKDWVGVNFKEMIDKYIPNQP